MRRLLRFGGLSLLLVWTSSAAASTSASASAERLNAVAARYEAFTRQFPMEAGRSDLASGRTSWPDETPAAMAERAQGLRQIKAALDELDEQLLSRDERSNLRYLRAIVGWRLQGLAFDERRFAFVAHDGFYNVPYYAARSQRLQSAVDAQAWLDRLRTLPAYYQQQLDNLARGVATGWTQPARVVDVAVAVLSAQLNVAADEDPLLEPLRSLRTVSAEQREQLLQQAVLLLSEAVRPAQRAARDYIDGEYRAAARSELGIASIPDGRAYYDFLLSYYTTMTLSAEGIHELGLSEVRRIRSAMEEVIAEVGFTGSFAQWLEFLRSDPRFYAESREALLDRAAVIAKRIDAQLPAWFGVLPRQPFAIEAVPRDVEENYTTARYSGGDFTQGFPGRYLVNTSHLDQRPLYELPALTLHEAAPGHHTHTALSRENTALPFYRQARDSLVYREGWALYAERLGHEMGVYLDPYERFGALSNEMWRACRMVVDTGLHVLGWSYEQARSCFTQNSALADINIDTELARYIGAPAGAVAYKLGELHIVSLREQAEQALGERFDVRRFHDVILAQGQLPMTELSEVIKAWIESQGD